MRQAWLVLAMSAATVTRADAKPEACSCPTRVVLPQPDAQGLPLNTKVWVLDNGGGFYPREPQLVAGEAFVDSQLGVRFTPTGETDTTPPATPARVSGSLVVNADTWQAETMSLVGDFAPDTAVVDIEIPMGGYGTYKIATTPSRLTFCQPNMRLGIDHVQIRITARDLAGNASAPVEVVVTPTLVAHHDPDTDCKLGIGWAIRRAHGHGFEIIFLFACYVGWLFGWLIVALVRRIGARSAAEEPLSRLQAEEIVRRLLRWQVVWSAMLVVSIVGLLAASSSEDMQLLAYALVPVGIVALGKLINMRRAQYLLSFDTASAARYGRWLDVRTATTAMLLRADEIDFVVAKRSSIPRSEIP